MPERPLPHELYYQAINSHGAQGEEAVRREYHRLLAEHGHLVRRPDCTCPHAWADPTEHDPGCPRYRDNDRRLECGWLPGQRSPRLTVVVTGARDWRHLLMLKIVLSGLATAYVPDFELLVGDCPTGADAQILEWARVNEWRHRVFQARWDQMQAEGYPRTAAGPLRNREMLDILQRCPGEHLVVAFHNDLQRSKGTRDCVQEAKRRGLPVYLVSKL
jgi:hypothetical protein